MVEAKKKLSGYDKYVDWRLFSIPVGVLILLLFIPLPKSMLDVGIEYSLGPKHVRGFIAEELFNTKITELSQWQIQMIRMMERSIQKSSFSLTSFIERDEKWCETNSIPTTKEHLDKVIASAVKITPEEFRSLMDRAYQLRTEELSFDNLSEKEKVEAMRAGFHVKMAVGIVFFVVLCFMTEAIPLPMVAFSIGIIAVMSGIVTRETVAGLYWSDATWFIMGSLMFARPLSRPVWINGSP